jgi:hypothetical protein
MLHGAEQGTHCQLVWVKGFGAKEDKVDVHEFGASSLGADIKGQM